MKTLTNLIAAARKQAEQREAERQAESNEAMRQERIRDAARKGAKA